jgi:hypothetical protein
MKPNPAILLTLFVLSFSAMGQYQNHSGLKNRKLRLANVDNHQTFDQVQGGLPSEEKLPDWPPGGKSTRSKSGIDSVIVLDDAPLQLTVMVYFSGVSKANIQVSVATDKAQSKSYIAPQIVTVMEGQSPAEITLKAVMPENMEIQSKFLSVEMKDPDRIAQQKDYIFSLGKRWTSQIKGENLVQIINLEPIGSAVSLWQLGAADPLPNPSKAVASTTPSLTTRTGIPAPGPTGDKTPRGPSRQPFSLWDNIKTDIDFELSDINNIRTEIYPDINPASETFYISPVAYNLRWNKEEGYQNFKVLYGANNEVMFNAGLDAGITSKQLETTRYLIRKLMKSQNVEMSSPKIQLFGANTAPAMSLKSDFQGVFQIDPSKLDVTAPTDFTSPLQVSWATDNKTRDMIVLALQNGVGLNGTLTFGTDSIVRKIPVSIAFNDKRNYGKIILEKENWRQSGWQNPFPYPVKIRYMHALLDNGIQNDGSNYIYSWNCNGPVAPPSSRINFNGAKIPQWFDSSNKVIQIWLEYDIMPCPSCTQTLLQSLTTGLSGSSESNITFQSMDLVSSLDAKLVQVRIKSIQADPAHNREAEISANITKDGDDIKIGPLYPGQDKRLSYQYKIIVVNSQAQIETSWISETSPQVYLNKANLERIMGRPLK